MSAPCILLTGFEPFDGEALNPSWQVAQALAGVAIGGTTVQALQLPCSFGSARARLQQGLRQHRPGLVVCLGQAGGRPGIGIERVAINVDDAPLPDNEGQQPIDAAIEPRGPAAYFSTLPIKAIARALTEAGHTATVSQTAGTYVCNHVFYGLMHALRRRPGVRGGFIHLPYAPGQHGARPGVFVMPLSEQQAAVRLALATAQVHLTDLHASGGATA
jgi:pyroglutamyl-peptidase